MKQPTPFVFEDTGDVKRFAPATERNREVIAGVLAGVLPAAGTVLEVASGTGEHVVHFARQFPDLIWQPSDFDQVGLTSIAAWTAESGLNNVLSPARIDATAPIWPIERADAILCINMVHIAPWQATLGLIAGAGRLLPKNAPLFLYGPYLQQNVLTAPSNQSFDESLKARNPEWGLRHVEAITAEAAQCGLQFERVIEMPANNLSLVYRKG